MVVIVRDGDYFSQKKRRLWSVLSFIPAVVVVCDWMVVIGNSWQWNQGGFLMASDSRFLPIWL